MPLSILALLVSCAAVPETVPPLILELREVPKQNAHAHGSVRVEVILRNVGERKLVLPAIMTPPHYWLFFRIRGPKGEDLSDPQRLVNPMWQDAKAALLPGYFFGTTIDLSVFYKLSSPGEYKISAVYGRPPTPLDLKVPLAKSATITVVLEQHAPLVEKPCH